MITVIFDNHRINKLEIINLIISICHESCKLAKGLCSYCVCNFVCVYCLHLCVCLLPLGFFLLEPWDMNALSKLPQLGLTVTVKDSNSEVLDSNDTGYKKARVT